MLSGLQNLGIGVDWVHFVAVSIWLGGLATTVFVVPVALRVAASNGQRILAGVVSRFSNLALVCAIASNLPSR